MKVKVIATNVIEECGSEDYVPEEHIIEIDEKDTLNDLKKKIGLEEYMSVSFDKYYHMDCKQLVSLENIIPFKINANDGVEWECDLGDVTIEEFIKSNNIDIVNGIEIEYGYPMAGGPRIFSINC